jgi:hypothetical protein
MELKTIDGTKRKSAWTEPINSKEILLPTLLNFVVVLYTSAVDTDEVYMTTQIRWREYLFSAFNLGTTEKGNPPNCLVINIVFVG